MVKPKPAHERLALYLDEAGLNQAAFVHRTGIAQSMLSRILSGKRRPGLDTATAIERGTGGKIRVTDWAQSKAEQRG